MCIDECLLYEQATEAVSDQYKRTRRILCASEAQPRTEINQAEKVSYLSSFPPEAVEELIRGVPELMLRL